MPTYNHGHAIRAVLDGLAPLGLTVIVVDDGSQDDTASTIKAWQRDDPSTRLLVTHDVNQGKAAALLTGFARARDLGFSHALTIDSDGQHTPADLQSVLGVSIANPKALVVGARPRHIVGVPFASRVGRWFSNRCVWIASGVRITDSQSGLRSYPLHSVGSLDVRSGRYGFETEILTHAGWAGIPVLETPIASIYDVAGGRVTHFKKGADSWAAVSMHSRLIAKGLLPGESNIREAPQVGRIPRRLWWWISPARLWAMVRGDEHAKKQLAASAGVGLFMAAAPFYGIKTALCLWISAKFRLHPAVVIAGSALSTPPVGLVFIFAGLVVGHLALHGSLPTHDQLPEWSHMDWHHVWEWFWEWMLGGVIVGIVIGLVAYVVVKVALRFVKDAGGPAPAPD